MSPFKQDRLENEKEEPCEGSAVKYINIPLILLALFFGFGVTYLALRTSNTSMHPGDSRTTAADAPQSGTEESLAGLMERGKQVYTTTCQACHQANGAGIPGAFPPLSESEWVMGAPKRTVAIVLHGLEGEITVKGQKFQGVMPPFKDQLKAEEIAALVSYVRDSFGNKAGAVGVDLVQQVIDDTKSRASSWNGEAELNSKKWE